MKIYKFSKFKSNNKIASGISTKDFGSMKNEDNSINGKNLEIFLKSLGSGENVVRMRQIHSGNVEVVTNNVKSPIENTDGLITDKKNVSLCVLTADCLPIVFYDIQKQVIGIAHGGRKGLQSGIIENIVEKFKNDFKSDSADIIAGVGPGIEKKCYEVDGELIDIRKWANDLLLKEGIKRENIENLEICTKCDSEEFYSYRGGDSYNRFATVISLV